jgi:hypothetical protein
MAAGGGARRGQHLRAHAGRPVAQHALIAFLLACYSSWRTAEAAWTSLTSFKHAMYDEMKYSRACYKLLNATGPVGCEGEGGMRC